MKNAIINARIESELKLDVEAILKNLGLTANLYHGQPDLHDL